MKIFLLKKEKINSNWLRLHYVDSNNKIYKTTIKTTETPLEVMYVYFTFTFFDEDILDDFYLDHGLIFHENFRDTEVKGLFETKEEAFNHERKRISELFNRALEYNPFQDKKKKTKYRSTRKLKEVLNAMR